DAIFMLYNWDISIGARAELKYAQELDKVVFYSLAQARNWLEERGLESEQGLET
ncbi:hypothetical protein LCGC14_2170480, partial [marine sediment metagenome]